MIVLGIETSCDETGVALYSGSKGLLAHALYSQISLHQEYGGVVPELASRDHVRKLPQLVRKVLDDAQISQQEINGVAYTAGPGLVGALLVGAGFGRALAWGLDIPAVAIHHMEGHLLAPMLTEPRPAFPFVALLVSGGHTQLIRVEDIGRYQLLGDTRDDAAGEAFDKTAKLMGLPYPGGPAIAQCAQRGHADRFKFPRPMLDRPGLEFSFSGLKTFAMNTMRQHDRDEQTCADIAYAFQRAVVETLTVKSKRALLQAGLDRLVVSGGVGANLMLRESLKNMGDTIGAEVFYPPLEFCTDNGAMIAYAGYRRLIAGERQAEAFTVYPRWSMERLSAVEAR